MNKWVNRFCGVLYGLLIPIGLYNKMKNPGQEIEEVAQVVHFWNYTTPETGDVCERRPTPKSGQPNHLLHMTWGIKGFNYMHWNVCCSLFLKNYRHGRFIENQSDQHSSQSATETKQKSLLWIEILVNVIFKFIVNIFVTAKRQKDLIDKSEMLLTSVSESSGHCTYLIDNWDHDNHRNLMSCNLEPQLFISEPFIRKLKKKK